MLTSTPWLSVEIKVSLVTFHTRFQGSSFTREITGHRHVSDKGPEFRGKALHVHF